MPDIDTQPDTRGRLLRILGVSFGIAIVVGGTVGVGILRNPGGVAAQLPSVWLILLVWFLGGIYCLLAANYLAELASMSQQTGGYYVYARRALGDRGGFVVGWSDWLYQTLGLSFIAVVFGEYASELFSAQIANAGIGTNSARIAISSSVIIGIAGINLIGLRSGSSTQKLTSLVKCLALVAFVAACFIYGGGPDSALSNPQAVLPASMTAGSILIASILAFQLVLSTYDGWHIAIYFTEEDTDPTRNLPRSLFGGILLIVGIYLLVNIALLYVLPMSSLAGSKFAGADVATLLLGEIGGKILIVLALLSLVGIINAILLVCPRILLALGRDGLFVRSATAVNRGGTPVIALMATAAIAVALSAIGSFEMLLAISQFFFVFITSILVVSLFVLRRREPDAPRPFRAWGYPIAPLLVLVISVLLAIGYVVSNTEPSLYAIAVLALAFPVFNLIRRYSSGYRGNASDGESHRE